MGEVSMTPLLERIAEAGRLAVKEMNDGQSAHARGYLAEREGLCAAQDGRHENLFVEQALRDRYEMGWRDGSKLKEIEEAITK